MGKDDKTDILDKIDDGSLSDKELNQIIINATHDAKLWKKLSEDLFLSNDRKSLIASDKTHTLHQFAPYSLIEDCAHCAGTGRSNCTTCHGFGQKNCEMCNGYGRIDQKVAYPHKNPKQSIYRNEWRICPDCAGSGNQPCASCARSGKEKCPNCSGHGYFTITEQIKLIATPTQHINVQAPCLEKLLQLSLQNKGVAFCAKRIGNMELIKSTTIAHDKQQFKYAGKAPFITQFLSIRKKQNNKLFSYENSYHIACAISNPPYLFFKPHLFDDIFADKIAFLKAINPNKINTTKTMKFFNRYGYRLIIKEIIQQIAKNDPEYTKQHNLNNEVKYAILMPK